MHTRHTCWLEVFCAAGLWTGALSHYELSRASVNWSRAEPEFWPYYVDKFLASLFTNATSVSAPLINFFFLSKEVSKLFHEFSLLLQKPDLHLLSQDPSYCPLKNRHDHVFVLHSLSQDIHHGILKRPTGHAEFYRPPHCPKVGLLKTDQEAAAESPHWRWVIYLDPRLRFNVTFHFIYFSAVRHAFRQCRMGYLKLAGIKAESFCQISGNEKLKEMNHFVFCGIHSETSIFPFWSCIDMGVYAYMYVVYDMLFSYTVLDRDMTVSLVHRNQAVQTQKFALVQATHIRDHYLPICVYHILTEKVHRIHIKIAQSASVVKLHDGPGALSKAPIPFEHSPHSAVKEYLTITFQCVMYVWCNDTTLKNIISVSFSNQTVHHNITFSQTGNSHFIFPEAIEDCPVKTILIKTDIGSHVNVSVSHMKYNGNINTMDCIFGGLSAYQGDREISTLCVKTNNISENTRSGIPVRDEYIFPNIYSFTHELILVLFSFAEYAKITFKVTVSSTRCRPVDMKVSNKSLPFTSVHIQNFGRLPIQRTPRFFEVNEISCLVVTLEANQHIGDPTPLHRAVGLLHWLRMAVKHRNQGGHLITLRATSFFRGQ